MSQETSSSTTPCRTCRLCLAALVLLVALVAGLTFLRAMERDLNHDEHQFIAPGVLMSREGLAPYRDFAIYHVPNLIWLYALVDRAIPNPILAFKAVSVASTAGVLLIIMVAVWWPRRALRPKTAIGIAALLGAMILLDPLFLFTTGKTWNHEWPALCVVAGIAAQLWSFQQWRLPLATVAGLFIGLAAGGRMTNVPLAGASVLGYLLLLSSWRERLSAVSCFLAGWMLGMAPTLYYLAKYPDRFLFDNFSFPRLRLLDPEDTRVQKTMTLARKVRFLFKEVFLRSWAVTLLYVATAGPLVWQAVRARHWPRPAIVLPALMVPFIIAGCFAPSRYQYQHFYLLVPVLGLSIAVALSQWEPTRRRVITLTSAMLVAVAAMAWDPKWLGGEERDSTGLRAYEEVADMLQCDNWWIARAGRQYRPLVEHVPAGGHVLTLAPSVPLQLGYRIYPELATGPFAWRLANLASAESRQRHRILAPADLPALLAQHPPDAIVIGHEKKELEAPFLAYAKQHHYRSVKIAKERHIYVKP